MLVLFFLTLKLYSFSNFLMNRKITEIEHHVNERHMITECHVMSDYVTWLMHNYQFVKETLETFFIDLHRQQLGCPWIQCRLRRLLKNAFERDSSCDGIFKELYMPSNGKSLSNTFCTKISYLPYNDFLMSTLWQSLHQWMIYTMKL